MNKKSLMRILKGVVLGSFILASISIYLHRIYIFPASDRALYEWTAEQLGVEPRDTMPSVTMLTEKDFYNHFRRVEKKAVGWYTEHLIGSGLTKEEAEAKIEKLVKEYKGLYYPNEDAIQFPLEFMEKRTRCEKQSLKVHEFTHHFQQHYPEIVPPCFPPMACLMLEKKAKLVKRKEGQAYGLQGRYMSECIDF